MEKTMQLDADYTELLPESMDVQGVSITLPPDSLSEGFWADNIIELGPDGEFCTHQFILKKGTVVIARIKCNLKVSDGEVTIRGGTYGVNIAARTAAHYTLAEEYLTGADPEDVAHEGRCFGQM